MNRGRVDSGRDRGALCSVPAVIGFPVIMRAPFATPLLVAALAACALAACEDGGSGTPGTGGAGGLGGTGATGGSGGASGIGGTGAAGGGGGTGGGEGGSGGSGGLGGTGATGGSGGSGGTGGTGATGGSGATGGVGGIGGTGATGGTGGTGATGGDDFSIRVPGSHSIPCPNPVDPGAPPEPRELDDTDHVCRLQAGAVDREIYVQATPTGCEGFMGGHPVFDGGVTAYVKGPGGIESADARYDWGGNHHNDWITIAVEGDYYTIYHSSLGWGGRACAPPDCVLSCRDGAICEPYGDTVREDGCAREAGSGPPPVPVVCVQVNADGTVPELLDPWTTNDVHPDAYPLLPCQGE
jgi:hypothetical protein